MGEIDTVTEEGVGDGVGDGTGAGVGVGVGPELATTVKVKFEEDVLPLRLEALTVTEWVPAAIGKLVCNWEVAPV